MIILAIANNGHVTAYNEKKEVCFKVSGEAVYGYTQSSVAVKQADNYYIYDETGNKIGVYSYDFIDTSNIAGMIIG